MNQTKKINPGSKILTVKNFVPCVCVITFLFLSSTKEQRRRTWGSGQTHIDHLFWVNGRQMVKRRGNPVISQPNCPRKYNYIYIYIYNFITAEAVVDASVVGVYIKSHLISHFLFISKQTKIHTHNTHWKKSKSTDFLLWNENEKRSVLSEIGEYLCGEWYG